MNLATPVDAMDSPCFAKAGPVTLPTTPPTTSNPPSSVPVTPYDNYGAPYDNYGTANAGRAMCSGDPGRPESMPGGTASQTFTAPAGVRTLTARWFRSIPIRP
jgi:hypothetical protein